MAAGRSGWRGAACGVLRLLSEVDERLLQTPAAHTHIDRQSTVRCYPQAHSNARSVCAGHLRTSAKVTTSRSLPSRELNRISSESPASSLFNELSTCLTYEYNTHLFALPRYIAVCSGAGLPCIQDRHAATSEGLMEQVVSEQLQHIPVDDFTNFRCAHICTVCMYNACMYKQVHHSRLSPVSAHCGANAYSGRSLMKPSLKSRRSSRPFSYSLRRLLCSASAEASAVSSSSAARSATRERIPDTLYFPPSSA